MYSDKKTNLFLIENLYRRQVLIEKTNNSFFEIEIELDYKDINSNEYLITSYDKNQEFVNKIIGKLHEFKYYFTFFSDCCIILGNSASVSITCHPSFHSGFSNYGINEIKWPYFHIGSFSGFDTFSDYYMKDKEIIFCGMKNNKPEYFKIILLNSNYF